MLYFNTLFNCQQFLIWITLFIHSPVSRHASAPRIAFARSLFIATRECLIISDPPLILVGCAFLGHLIVFYSLPVLLNNAVGIFSEGVHDIVVALTVRPAYLIDCDQLPARTREDSLIALCLDQLRCLSITPPCLSALDKYPPNFVFSRPAD